MSGRLTDGQLEELKAAAATLRREGLSDDEIAGRYTPELVRVLRWPPAMGRLLPLEEADPILHAALGLGRRRGLPSLVVLSAAWRETLRAARRHVADVERLAEAPMPGASAMLDYLARRWREAAYDEGPYARRRRRWRAVAEDRVGLLAAASLQRADLLRLLARAHALWGAAA